MAVYSLSVTIDEDVIGAHTEYVNLSDAIVLLATADTNVTVDLVLVSPPNGTNDADVSGRTKILGDEGSIDVVFDVGIERPRDGADSQFAEDKEILVCDGGGRVERIMNGNRGRQIDVGVDILLSPDCVGLVERPEWECNQ